jgi:branched-subunit amino acid permease
MRHENENPTKRLRLVALFTIVVVVLVVVVAAVVVGPGRAIGWVGDYLIPVGLVVVVLGVAFGLFLRWGGKFYDMMYPRR